MNADLHSNSKLIQFYNKFFRFKAVIVVMCISLIALLVGQAQHLKFSNDYRAFFGDDNPQLNAFIELQNVYAKDDNILIVLEPKNGELFTKENLQAVIELEGMSWKVPFSTRVDSLNNFQHTIGEEDDLVVGNLYEEDALANQAQINKIKEIALSEPLLVHRLLNKEGTVTAVNITVELPGKSVDEVPDVTNYARKMIEKFEAKYPNISVYLTGMVILNNTFPESAKSDMRTLNPIMYFIIFVFIALLTRSVVGTFSTMLVIVLSIMATLGFAGLLRVELTPISMISMTVVMTLSVADCIHIILSFRKYLAEGYDKIHSVKESLRQNFQPVFLTSLTTAIGFLSLNFSDVPPFHDYGNMSAFGVMTAFILSVTILPIIMLALPAKVKKIEEKKANLSIAFTQWLFASKRKVLFGGMLVFIGLICFIPKIELNDQFVKYFSEDIDFRRDTDQVMNKLTGIYNLSYSLKAENGLAVSSPDYLNKVEEFATWMRSQGDVVHVNTITDIFKRLNKNMHGDDASFYKLPDNPELSAQYLLLYEMSLPYGLDLNSQINLDKTASKVIVTLKNTSTRNMRELEALSNEWIADKGKGVISGIASSPSVMFSHISQRNIDSMIWGTLFAIGLITVILIIALRSLKFGLLSLIPNVMPIAMAFGAWGLLVGQIGMAVATIAGLTIGIVVDDTVHFISKYLRARREKGYSPEQAIEDAFANVAQALFTTSVILVAGFLVMSASSFKMNWTMGLMSAITISLALLADFILLPIFILYFEKLISKKEDQVVLENAVSH